MAAITFSDEDLQLGGEHYNRPLYITGTIRDTKINRILLDCGSVVNLLPVKSLKAMGLMTSHLSPMFHTIQDRQVVVHKLAISKEKKPVKQAERRFRPELTVQIKCEVNMLIEVGIEESKLIVIKSRLELKCLLQETFVSFGICKGKSSISKLHLKFNWEVSTISIIKKYLTNPPVLLAPVQGRPLILYTHPLNGL
ncbi:hypothetical protein V2J09_021214 [Rumex salicifolius]